MRRVSLELLQPGMITAKPVFGTEGQILINSGVEIKQSYIKHLKSLALTSIYIYDSRLEGVEVEDVIAESTRMEARSITKEIMVAASESSNGKVRISYLKEEKLTRVVDKIIDDLLSNKDAVVNLADIRSADGYTFSHCVNVSILSALTAAKLNYSNQRLKDITAGAILHDLGKIRIPKSILNKPGKLTKEEFGTIQEHVDFGYKIFKETSLHTVSSAAVVLQHHERQRGQGYPQGLHKEDINPLAQIAAIADVYDALISDRPYRQGMQPHQVVEMLSAQAGVEFNVEFLRVFLSFIAAYPVGTHVLLSNGESGLVISNKAKFPLRPKVRILYIYNGENLEPHHNPYELDLLKVLDLVVIEVVREEVATNGIISFN